VVDFFQKNDYNHNCSPLIKTRFLANIKRNIDKVAGVAGAARRAIIKILCPFYNFCSKISLWITCLLIKKKWNIITITWG